MRRTLLGHCLSTLILHLKAGHLGFPDLKLSSPTLRIIFRVTTISSKVSGWGVKSSMILRFLIVWLRIRSNLGSIRCWLKNSSNWSSSATAFHCTVLTIMPLAPGAQRRRVQVTQRLVCRIIVQGKLTWYARYCRYPISHLDVPQRGPCCRIFSPSDSRRMEAQITGCSPPPNDQRTNLEIGTRRAAGCPICLRSW